MMQADLEPYLNEGERILWMGQAPRGLFIRWQDLIFGPFILLWSLVVITWIPPMVRDAFSTPGDALGLLLFTPAFVFALYLVIGRYVLDALKRRNTTYLITDRRAVIVSGLLRKRAKSRVITPEMEATVSRARWGRRALMIGPGADGYDFILRRSMFSRVHCHPFAFERLPDALRAYKILRKQQKASA